MANVEFGTGKTVLILTIVVACFAVLWPKIFYPMFVSTIGGKPDLDDGSGCCDVIFETDVNAINIMSEMCGSIFKKHEDLDPKLTRAFQDGKYSKKLVDICRSEVMNICGTDIAEILNEKVRLGQSYRQILDEIRSYNISVCLRQNFGVSPGSLGIPRRMRLWGPAASKHLRQERPLHLHPEMMHPALRERGRAIPQGGLPDKKVDKDGSLRPPAIPGMRPPMGGAGHVVPAPKVGATMSIVMPLYTIGIVIFSMYTIMKVFVRKTGNSDHYKDFSSDPEFRRVVFADEYSNGCTGSSKEDSSSRSKLDPPLPVFKTPSEDTTRLVMTAITGLLAEMDQQLGREGDTQTQYSTDLKEEQGSVEEICTEEKTASGKLELNRTEQVDKRGKSKLQVSVSDGKVADEPAEDDSKPKVKVMGVETVAECEDGQRWSRPATPTLGVGSTSVRGTTRLPENVEPSNIFLEGTLPTQSQLLVTDSKTQTLTLPQEDGSETPVILSGKVTLSLISLDARLPADGTSHTDSAVMEDAVSLQRNEEAAAEGECEKNEEADEDGTTHYTTATMSEEAEAAEAEDTRAEISNIEALGTAEDQDELEDDGHDWNGAEGEVRTSQLTGEEQKED